MIAPRDRSWPSTDLDVAGSVVGFMQFVHTTSVNKIAGLSEEQARLTPLPDSPVTSPLGLLKHMTAVLRQHVQIHIGGSDLPPLWRADDRDHEFRAGC